MLAMAMPQGLWINLEENYKKDANSIHKNGWDLIHTSKLMRWELILQLESIAQQKIYT